MSCYSKEKIDKCDYNYVCKSHSARSDRELYRICPSKLSKRELEDLYFTLLENNLELKRTINGQQDKIRSLSTKVQRMTAAQKNLKSKEMKDCCVGTKCIMNEQQDSIEELKRINHRMAEKIRMLNMRLCSAKQFYKTTPPSCASRCLRCVTAASASTPKKHSCSPKPSEPVVKTSVSCQNLDKETMSTKSAQTETRELESQNAELPCDENKCRTTMEELKQKIVILQEELCHAHEGYSSRISRLESEVSEVRKENVRVRSERCASELELQHSTKRTSDLLNSLRTAEARCAELSTQLTIERRKEAELETRLKAATISDRVNKTIEDHLTTMNVQEPNVSAPKAVSDASKCECYPSDTEPKNEAIVTKANTVVPREARKEKSKKKRQQLDNICACDIQGAAPFQEPNSNCICACYSSASIVKTTSKKKLKCICKCPPQAENISVEPSPNEMRARTAQRAAGSVCSPEASPDHGKMTKTLDDSGYLDASKSPDSNNDVIGRKIDKRKSTSQNLEPNNMELIHHHPKRLVAEDGVTSKSELNRPGKQQLDTIEYQDTFQFQLTDPKQRSMMMIEDFESKTTDDVFGKSLSTRSLPSKSDLIFGRPNSIKNEKREPNQIELLSSQQKTEVGSNKRELESGNPILSIHEDRGPNNIEIVPDSNTETNVECRQNNQESAYDNLASKDYQESNKIEDLTRLPNKSEPQRPTRMMKCWNREEASTSKELCEICAVCTFEKECELHRYDDKDYPKCVDPRPKETGRVVKDDRHNSLQIPGPIPAVDTNNMGQVTKNNQHNGLQISGPLQLADTNNKPEARKDDQHNSLQIPGPMPVVENSNKDCKRNVFNRLSVDNKRKDFQKKDKNGEQGKEMLNPVTIRETEKTQMQSSAASDAKIQPDVPNFRKYEENNTHIETEEDLITHPQTLTKRDSIEMNRERLEPKQTMEDNLAGPAQDIQDTSMQNYYAQSDHTLAMNNYRSYNVNEQALQMEQKLEEIPQVHIELQSDKGSSSVAHKRDVSMYRRQSGTLCFHMVPAGRTMLLCRYEHRDRDLRHCVGKTGDKGAQPRINNRVEVDRPGRERRQSLTSEQGTYTVSSSRQTRATSPDNTECEISSMTDLPSERDPKSPIKSHPQSPGEDKMTTTYTDSYTSPVTNYTLSEGELPAATVRRTSNYSQRQDNTSVPEGAAAQKMEAALQAITDELARCKNLLLSQRPREPQGSRRESSQSATSMSDGGTRPITLRRGVATQSIGDAYAPKCIFTLHIGTVVLSDEAVLSSRNKNLILTWKFYDQNVAMTRMRAGRVVLFDFSTEYDIKITEKFLDYMKHEEMPIVICELEKQDEPFASCTLPLRDALLHTNRRADMSLALVAGPQMLSARAANNAAADALDAGDEMGVIDLWCMLRADGKHLPAINRAIARPSPPIAKSSHHVRSSRIMPQVLDDEPSNEFTELDLTLQERKTTPLSEAEGGKNIYKDVEYARTSVRRWGSGLFKFPDTIEIDNGSPPPHHKTQQTYDPSKYPACRRNNGVRHSVASGAPARTSQAAAAAAAPRDLATDDPERDSSDIIVNEVVAKIKSPEDMRNALRKSSLQNDFTRMPKSEEEAASQAPGSSVGSLKSIVARLQRTSRNPDYKQEGLRRSSLSPDVRKYGTSKHTDTRQNRSLTIEETNGMEIYRKYDNISKWLGSNRTEASKKSVKIVPKYLESPTDQPQRDISEAQPKSEERDQPHLDITILWLALNEECEAMINPHVQRVYVAYSFLGRSGAELETPISLPKPKHYVDKCYFNFRKSFILQDNDLPILGHMARCRAASKISTDDKDCIVFSVVSEPPEDPLGLESCEDIGYAYLYLGDLLAYSTGSTGYTEVVPVRAARGADAVCGVLAVRLDGLDVLRRCLLLSNSQWDLAGLALP